MEDYLTLGTISKIVSIVIASLVVYKTFLQTHFLKRDKLKENYELVEKFIGDDKWKTMHDYQLEYAYWALSGKEYDASTIRYFLLQNNPLKKLVNYKKGQKYLALLSIDGDSQTNIRMISSLEDESKYKWKLRRRTFYYFIISFVGWIPFIFFPNIMDYSSSDIIAGALWVVSLSIIAFYFLLDIVALESAKKISELKENKC